MSTEKELDEILKLCSKTAILCNCSYKISNNFKDQMRRDIMRFYIRKFIQASRMSSIGISIDDKNFDIFLPDSKTTRYKKLNNKFQEADYDLLKYERSHVICKGYDSIAYITYGSNIDAKKIDTKLIDGSIVKAKNINCTVINADIVATENINAETNYCNQIVDYDEYEELMD